MDSRSVLARFESERQALALMEHPHIARVLDAGTAADGRPFFVMELVKGIPITEYCDAHRLDIPARLALFRQVCSAVQHAHQKGIIHRDLKPSNILVEAHDDRPVPKVIDFGLAKAISGMRLSEQSLFTAFGSVAGTPLYMAPEQARFHALDIDTRADIYALGAILYELLTGSTPIARESVQRAAMDEMLRVIREVEPPAPSSRISKSEALPSLAANRQVEPARLSRLVRGDLDWIVMKALARERERRYDSAIGLGNDVERFLNHEPVSAGPPTAAYRLRKFVRRNRTRVTAAALVLLALVLGMIGTTLGLIEARRQRRQAEKGLAQVTKMNEILGSIFRDLDPNKAQKEGKPLSAVLGERLDRATAEIEGEATGDPLAVARMQMSLGEAQHGLGYPAKAAALYEKARATRAARLGPDHPETLASLSRVAASSHDAGRRDEALRLREEALARAKATLGPDDPGIIWSMAGLAISYADAGRRDEALRLREQVLALRRAKLGPDHPEMLASMADLAASYVQAGRRGEALRLREQVLALCKATLGPDHPETSRSMAHLAASYRDAGRRDEALKLREEALALRKAKLGPDHPDTIWSMLDLTASYADAGRRDEALKLREEALERARAKLGPDHPHTIWSMAALADSYREAGRRDEALRLNEQVLALRRAKLGAEGPKP
jgi:tetratricopeptide (TPR) repeat protein